MVGQIRKYNKSHLNQVLDIFKTEEKLLGLVPDDALQKGLDDIKKNLLNVGLWTKRRQWRGSLCSSW